MLLRGRRNRRVSLSDHMAQVRRLVEKHEAEKARLRSGLEREISHHREIADHRRWAPQIRAQHRTFADRLAALLEGERDA